MFCLGGAEPTSFTDVLFDLPWREIPPWIGDLISGQAPFALLLFALCLAVSNLAPRSSSRSCSASARFAFGTARATIRGASPTARYRRELRTPIYAQPRRSLTSSPAIAFVVAFVRTRGAERQRTAGSSRRLRVAGAGRIASDTFFPAYLNFWENGTLLSLSIVP